MTDRKVVNREEWQAARDELLQREKQHTRMGDELARQRRELPWVAIHKQYRFDTDGERLHLQDGVVYQTYATTWRGVEFLMGYYPILDRVPKGRDEDDGWQLWIRRHDEYVQGRAVR
jgi:predicted dithiol-disulfide oxidoreductase (DUF899 family)